MRKIVQMSSFFNDAQRIGSLLVLCDDGSLWERSENQAGGWVKHPDIPPDRFDSSTAKVDPKTFGLPSSAFRPEGQ